MFISAGTIVAFLFLFAFLADPHGFMRLAGVLMVLGLIVFFGLWLAFDPGLQEIRDNLVGALFLAFIVGGPVWIFITERNDTKEAKKQ